MRGNVLAVSYGVLKCSHRAGTVQDSASAHTTMSLNSFLFAVSVFPDLWMFFSTSFILVYFLCFVVPLFSFALFFLYFVYFLCVHITFINLKTLYGLYFSHICSSLFGKCFLASVSFCCYVSVKCICTFYCY